MSEVVAGEQRHTNRLAGETSPYLLQHAHNPVDWWPWGPDALARAKLLDRPIFLSIGYAACHWCHVMERESFEDEGTAAFLNARFIPIKVDREERPDLDQVYMAAVQAMTGGGGWPMSVFLTPAGRPFYGGTYFPPEPRHGLPSFRQVLEGVDRTWQEDRAGVEGAGTRLVAALSERAAPQPRDGTPTAEGAPTPELLDTAVALIDRGFDATTGGWGGAPKFPQPMTIEFLLGRAAATGDERPLAIARRSLEAMADGGIHDQLGGGFHRYSTDARWLVPHFEKMLYDNAQLARAYWQAWALTSEPRWREVGEGALGYMVSILRTNDCGFAASEDADTDGVEGATATWTAEQIRDVLDEERWFEVFAAAYGVTPGGNWEGVTILSRVRTEEQVAADLGIELEVVHRRLGGAIDALAEARGRRPQPARDDKVLAAWNGLAIGAFAEAAARLGVSEVSTDRDLGRYYAEIGSKAADGVLRGLYHDGRLQRSWKDGRATGEGVLEDYACLAEGLLALYGATFEERWFLTARALMDAVLERFADPAGGFFDTADDHERLITRPKDIQDNATPSGGAMASNVLLRLAALTGEGRYRAAAERAVAAVVPLAGRYPTAAAKWLSAIELALSDIIEIAIVGSLEEPGTRELLAVALGGFRPGRAVALAADPAAGAVPLLEDRTRLGGRPTAYVCRNFACQMPVTDPEALAAQLRERAPGG
jgi:uncharacterized protein